MTISREESESLRCIPSIPFGGCVRMCVRFSVRMCVRPSNLCVELIELEEDETNRRQINHNHIDLLKIWRCVHILQTEQRI